MSMRCSTCVSMCCPTCVSMCCPTCVPWSIYHLATSARPPSPSNRSQSSVRRTQGRGNLLARAHVVTSFTKRWQGHPLTWSREVIQPEKGKSHSGLLRPPTTPLCVTSAGSQALLHSQPVLPADGGGGGLWRPATIRRTGPTVCPGSTQALLNSLQTSKCPMCRIGRQSNMVSILGLHMPPKCHLLSINRVSKDRNRVGRFQVALHKCRLLLDRGKVTEVVDLARWQESGALPRHS